MFYPRCRERYERFTLNPWSSLYDGLVFGGLGPNNRWSAGQGMYEDSTCYLNDGTVIGYTGAGDNGSGGGFGKGPGDGGDVGGGGGDGGPHL